MAFVADVKFIICNQKEKVFLKCSYSKIDYKRIKS